MALNKGQFYNFTLDRRRVLRSGNDPMLFPAPQGAYRGAFTNGFVVTNVQEFYLIGALYETAVGSGKAGQQVVEYANALASGVFKNSVAVPISFSGTVPATFLSIPSPTISYSSVGTGNLFRIDNLGSARRSALGANASQDAPYIKFNISPSAGMGVARSMQVDVSDIVSDILITGPLTQKTGRFEVKEVEARGTSERAILNVGISASIDFGRPIEGQVLLTGEAILDNMNVDDLDGLWTIDGQEWDFVSGAKFSTDRATVLLSRLTGR